MEYNVYCDESCHLRRDYSNVMVLGAIYCDRSKAKEINNEINALKEVYGFSKKSEIKWTKVSPSGLDFYLSLVDYFFNNEHLSFRGYIARGTDEIRTKSAKDYDTWYYKMYYRTLEYVVDQDVDSQYNIYLDIKDTIGSTKVATLKNYLNAHYGNGQIKKMQLVDSSDIAILQLADLLIGALAYKHRQLKTSQSKLEIINKIEELSSQDIFLSVPKANSKANWFVWVPDSWR